MKCQELLRMLNDYVDGDIDLTACAEFEQHLAECEPCTIVVDNVRRTITLFKNEGRYELPLRFHQQLHETLRRRWPERPTAAAGATAAPPPETPQ